MGVFLELIRAEPPFRLVLVEILAFVLEFSFGPSFIKKMVKAMYVRI